MAKEIEKKYLFQGKARDKVLYVLGLPEINLNKGTKIRQGYLPVDMAHKIACILNLPEGFKPGELRVRDKGGKYFLTAKSAGGIKRDEYEKQIDKKLFEALWPETEGRRIEKVRSTFDYGGHEVELDFFTDRKLILGEVEVKSLKEARKVSLPGKDVTEDQTYKNKNLAK
ncbi:MAG: adenylate cyclase [Nanoarchaeota archaeon]|nr:adenylate cyclase [Nanoarchaeota archaeon]MBU4124177.1 adenylate cyclase [Nanoarchaeota archaeon]